MSPWLYLVAGAAAAIIATLCLLKASVLMIQSEAARLAVGSMFLAVAGLGAAYYGISFWILSWIDESLDR